MICSQSGARITTNPTPLTHSAQTWIGMTPLWLMGEALIPGAKVGGTFKSGGKKMFGVAEELRDALMTDS